MSALKQIVRKGQGAYFSSGSRPNQTSQSWGLARLASSITAGKSAAVDYDILEKGCDHKKRHFFWRKNQGENTNLVIRKQERRQLMFNFDFYKNKIELLFTFM